MSEKDEEQTTDQSLEQKTTGEPKKVNIMDSSDANEPPKKDFKKASKSEIGEKVEELAAKVDDLIKKVIPEEPKKSDTKKPFNGIFDKSPFNDLGDW